MYIQGQSQLNSSNIIDRIYNYVLVGSNEEKSNYHHWKKNEANWKKNLLGLTNCWSHRIIKTDSQSGMTRQTRQRLIDM